MSEEEFVVDSDDSLERGSTSDESVDADFSSGRSAGGYLEILGDSDDDRPTKSYDVHDARSGEEILADLDLLMDKRTSWSPAACPECGKVCRTKNSLTRHSFAHTGVKPFGCPHCPAAFLTSSKLDNHQWRHTGNKPYKCRLCRFATTSTSALRKHEKIHRAEKNYMCDLCSYQSIRSDALREHYKKHSGRKPFGCPTCSYKCLRSADLRKHEATHSGEKKFKCGYCSFRCNVQSNMKRHEMRHTDRNGSKDQMPRKQQVSLVKCPLCSYCTANSKSLDRHIGEHAVEFVVIHEPNSAGDGVQNGAGIGPW